eukprot:CAMPEP_0171088102 /NCGR_PEP_ID=MMETSP0766_2-20121228/20575_1 /TAXON_ID=439317 /ORGANISM="Gambierdiscus australes, Strain CAWD 149" /LENGTH=173 /DNA_ID=CAMNT_0011545865 /DNA_START=193 /DNA_END=714 /DNA_ORIENTATION=+
MAADAIAAHSGVLRQRKAAQDHAVLASSGGLKSVMGVIAEAASASLKRLVTEIQSCYCPQRVRKMPRGHTQHKRVQTVQNLRQADVGLGAPQDAAFGDAVKCSDEVDLVQLVGSHLHEGQYLRCAALRYDFTIEPDVEAGVYASLMAPDALIAPDWRWPPLRPSRGAGRASPL